MRPVRFVALSEDGQALVLTDEVGRLLALPVDERVHGALRPDGERPQRAALASAAVEPAAILSPRDIQARIRSGESAEDVARIAGVPVDRVLRYAGPVLQERAMLAQYARRTKLRNSDKGATLAEVVDARLTQHGIDAEKISWDASRREDGTWRVIATWPSGKATAQAMWELDKARQIVTPFDDMAQYLCTDRATQLSHDLTDRHGHGLASPLRGESSRGELGRGGHEPIRPPVDPPSRRDARPGRPANDPIRSGRDALLASLDRPLGSSGRSLEPPPTGAAPAAAKSPEPTGGRSTRGGAAALIGSPSGSAFDEPGEPVKDVPSVPSLAVLRPRRTAAGGEASDQPRKRLPSWDDVLFGGGPAARESS
ncbi:MAG: DUF3071 domain-containing protein [Dactylosporangium sp.]|nr:DUF3071 domain-containing protein [Dactylosporangium sp.]NNJ59538.1 DUF3071 domain-containing protein [Dactylosporangium sp.]